MPSVVVSREDFFFFSFLGDIDLRVFLFLPCWGPVCRKSWAWYLDQGIIGRLGFRVYTPVINHISKIYNESACQRNVGAVI
jgi:hypothetical protein